jgi:CheY-like chemotaxis protein
MRSPPLILVADDHAANLDILRTRLTNQGYQVVTAVDGQEALEAAQRERPDLILLDVMMPKRDGFEVCRLLKADTSLPSCQSFWSRPKVTRAILWWGLRAVATST